MADRSVLFFLMTLFAFFCLFVNENGVNAASVPEVLEKRSLGVKQLQSRDIWSPKIVDPKVGTVWHVGELANITWCPDMPPKQITNSRGRIALRNSQGFVRGPGGIGEPLASNISLFDGHAVVEVPDVPAGDDYQVVLFGDSNNASPEFTISNTIISPNILPL